MRLVPIQEAWLPGSHADTNLVIFVGLQPLIFNVHTAMLPIINPSVLIRALDRWDFLWKAAMDLIPINQRIWLGVANNSHELSMLARRIIVVNMTKEATQSRYLQRVVSYSFADLHQFIRQYRYLDKQVE